MVYSVQEILFIWESYGIFDTLLPFLLIFAVVFGILTYMRIFGDNRGIHVILALVIGLLAIGTTYRTTFFSEFYREIFPRLGIGITVLLAIMILVGLFIPKGHKVYWSWGLAGIAVIIAIIIIVQTFGYLGWTYYGAFSNDIVAWVIGAILLLAIIIAVAVSSGGEKNTGQKVKDIAKEVLGGLWEK